MILMYEEITKRYYLYVCAHEWVVCVLSNVPPSSVGAPNK